MTVIQFPNGKTANTDSGMAAPIHSDHPIVRAWALYAQSVPNKDRPVQWVAFYEGWVAARDYIFDPDESAEA